MNKYFEELYDKYAGLAFKAAYKVLQDYHESEDVVIETFCKLYVCLKENKDIQNISGWLTVTATTTAIDLARKKRLILTDVAHQETDGVDFESAIIQKSLTNEMLRNLRKKNAKWFEYIGMHYLMGMSVEEIAQADCVTPKAVKSALTRAKRYLAQKYFPGGPDAIYPMIVILIELLLENSRL